MSATDPKPARAKTTPASNDGSFATKNQTVADISLPTKFADELPAEVSDESPDDEFTRLPGGWVLHYMARLPRFDAPTDRKPWLLERPFKPDENFYMEQQGHCGCRRFRNRTKALSYFERRVLGSG
jgi:hypothetical protein